MVSTSSSTQCGNSGDLAPPVRFAAIHGANTRHRCTAPSAADLALAAPPQEAV
jgi:hypothetical protein